MAELSKLLQTAPTLCKRRAKPAVIVDRAEKSFEYLSQLLDTQNNRAAMAIAIAIVIIIVVTLLLKWYFLHQPPKCTHCIGSRLSITLVWIFVDLRRESNRSGCMPCLVCLSSMGRRYLCRRNQSAHHRIQPSAIITRQ